MKGYQANIIVLPAGFEMIKSRVFGQYIIMWFHLVFGEGLIDLPIEEKVLV